MSREFGDKVVEMLERMWAEGAEACAQEMVVEGMEVTLITVRGESRGEVLALLGESGEMLGV